MKKYTHVKCLKDVKEDEVLLFKKGKVYKIVGFDYRSLIYYIEPEFHDGVYLPDEIAIQALDRNFEFITKCT